MDDDDDKQTRTTVRLASLNGAKEFIAVEIADDANPALILRVLRPQDRKTWKAIVSSCDLESLAQMRATVFSQFWGDTKRAFTATDDFYKLCIESSTKKTDNLRLLWKKQLDDGVFFTLGDVELLLCNEGLGEMMTLVVEHVRRMQQHVLELDKQNVTLKQHCDDALKNFESAIDEKQSTEAKLFTKFAALLNAKKRRIAELETTVERSTSETTTTSTSGISSRVIQDEVGDSDSDDTDTEKEKVELIRHESQLRRSTNAHQPKRKSRSKSISPMPLSTDARADATLPADDFKTLPMPPDVDDDADELEATQPLADTQPIVEPELKPSAPVLSDEPVDDTYVPPAKRGRGRKKGSTKPMPPPPSRRSTRHSTNSSGSDTSLLDKLT